jgi:hypothetical protein
MVLLAFVVGTTAAGELRTDSRTIALEGAKRLEITCTFAAGRLHIESGPIAEAAKISAEYDPDRVDLDVSYKVRGEDGRLFIETDHHGRRVDTDDNQMDLTLSDKIPAELRLKMGACKANIELGGIPLSALDLEIGAVSGTVEFSKPNPVRMKKMTIEVGASSAMLYQLGNANADLIKCEIGAASSHLDFSGEYHGETEVDVEVGVASADIVLPKNLPVRIECDDEGWFSSVKFRKRDLDEVDDGVWESPDFASAKDRLILRIEVGMGSVKLTWK